MSLYVDYLYASLVRVCKNCHDTALVSNSALFINILLLLLPVAEMGQTHSIVIHFQNDLSKSHNYNIVMNESLFVFVKIVFDGSRLKSDTSPVRNG